MEITNYSPLNYKEWILGDKAREGVNIKRLGVLNEMEEKILDLAVPYQDKRDDPGQAEIVTYFAIKLLDHFPEGKREIVVPAAILHDTGWHGNDPQEWDRLIAQHKGDLKQLDKGAIRRPHQHRGIMIAGKVLNEAGYFANNPSEYWLEIADIIGDHDTKELPTTENGRIMRAADLMWRMSYPHASRYLDDEHPKGIVDNVTDSTFTLPEEKGFRPLERKIARIELANTLQHKFGNDAKEYLKINFKEELPYLRLSK